LDTAARPRARRFSWLISSIAPRESDIWNK
jgi:hypothetical protein